MNKVQTLKGFRDFLPNEARKRQYVISTLRKVFESFGFEPLETPTLEYAEILQGKYGDEGEKLMYKFTDHGGRLVAMRYDQTVPLARVVTQFGNLLPNPFKRYQIQNVWRADNTQKGRFREFTQCDADTVGVDTPLSDAEIIAVAAKSLDELGLKKYKILFNSREILFNLTKQAGVPEDLKYTALQILDKRNKVKSINDLKSEWISKGLSEESFDKMESLVQKISITWSKEQKTGNLRLDEVYKQSLSLGLKSDNLQFIPSIVRGLDYYTGLIFEIELEGYTVGSVAGGGRYNNLIGMFAKQNIPAVGFALGFDRILEAMAELNLFPADLQTTQILVTIFNSEMVDRSIEINSLLRSNNIESEIWLDPNVKLEKQLKYADQKGIPYAIIIGPDEVKNNQFVLKNLKDRTQETVVQEELIKKLT